MGEAARRARRVRRERGMIEILSSWRDEDDWPQMNTDEHE
jgi:hypothetical protein